MENAAPSNASVGLIVLVPEVASARTVRFTLDELFRHAEAAVIGEVHGVVNSSGGRFADIHVHEVLKGEADPVIRVIAESAWRLDASDVLEAGSRIVLFLGKREAQPHRALAFNRGYMPFAGRENVRRLSGVTQLPASIADDVQRQDLQAVLTTEVFARYLATLD
ncbi:MAG: hypothetical protein ACAI38_05285 [Myxococcota bacterium]